MKRAGRLCVPNLTGGICGIELTTDKDVGLWSFTKLHLGNTVLCQQSLQFTKI